MFALFVGIAAVATSGVANAFVSLPQGREFSSSTAASGPLHAAGIWNSGNSFGKGDFKFYNGLDEWMAPFPDEDLEAFPELFVHPKGVYELKLPKPCGILFEEIEVGKGVYVAGVVEGGNADRQGMIKEGDVLVGVTAIRVSGAKFERRLLPARNWGFDLVVNAIGSNEMKWGCENVILLVERPGECDSAATDKFMEYYEPPKDCPWKN